MQRRKAITTGAGFLVALWFFFGVFGGHVTWLGFKGVLLLAASWFAASVLAGRVYDQVKGSGMEWPAWLERLTAGNRKSPVSDSGPSEEASSISAHDLAAIPNTNFTISANLDAGDAGPEAGFPPVQREVHAIVMNSSLEPKMKYIYDSFYRIGKFEKLQETLRHIVIPKVQPHERDALLNAGGSSRFASGRELVDGDFLVPETYRQPDAMMLGVAEPPIAEPAHPMVFQGEGHIATIATTGAGKGQRYILPTLMTYPGNVICLDPKGENYRHTKGARDLFGRVFRWAPFDKSSDTDSFNPLDAVQDPDDARVLADLLVHPSDSGEKAFWDSSARDVVRGLILYVKSLPKERRNIRELVRFLYGSEDDLDRLRDNMAESEDELVRESANQIEVMAERMFTSILQSARTELEAWRSPAIASCTNHTSENWDISAFVAMQRGMEKLIEGGNYPGPIGYKYHSNGREGVIERGTASSIFLVVPPDRIRSYASVLRVMLGMHLKALTAAEAEFETENPDLLADYSIPTLLLFDELPQLGYMQIVEEQILIARAARIRMWLVAQNLSQLKQVYPNWESMLANCRVQLFFGTNDKTTADYISDRCGVRSTIFNEVQPLASVTDITGRSFADHAIVFARGTNPVKLRLPPPFHADPRMERIRDFLRQTDSEVPRRERGKIANARPVAAEEINEGTKAGKQMGAEPGNLQELPDIENASPVKQKPRRRKARSQSTKNGGDGKSQPISSVASSEDVPASPRRRPRPRGEPG
jgi:hypothetical protein